MRRYYTGVIPREISNIRVLRALDGSTLQQVLDRRLTQEREELQSLLGGAERVVDRLARDCPTPLAFLRWVKFLTEEDWLEAPENGFHAYLECNYSNLEVDVLEAVARAFAQPERPLDADEVLAACGGNHAVFEQLQDRQVVLPRDFWNPTQFTLDPELYFVHPSRGFL